MDFLFPIVLIFFIFILIYIKLWKAYSFWEKRNIFSPPTILIFGNLKEFLFLKKSLGEACKEIYDKYRHARFLGLYTFLSPKLMLLDPEDIKRVFVTDFGHFQNRSNYVDKNSPPLTRNLINMHYEEWKPTRQKITPIFTSGKLKNMFPLIMDISASFSEYLYFEIEKNEEVEVHELMAKFSTDIIGSCAFGINMNSIKDENATFRKMGRETFKMDSVKFAKRILRITFPKICKFFGLYTFESAVDSFFRSSIEKIIEERKVNIYKRHDFIDLMLELKEKQENGNSNDNIEIDNDFIAAQSFVFFLAGFETSSGLMSFALHELALHEDIQTKLYQEIISTINKYKGKITYESIQEITYLDMVIDEVQRMYPAIDTLTRYCTKEYTFPESKFTIEKETPIIIPVRALHYDPQYYPDPEKFNPERFHPDVKKNIHPMTFLPFGEGPRNCIGLRFGKLQSKLGLITVLKDFIVEPCSMTTPKLIMNPSSFVTSSKNGMWLKIKKRR